MLKLFFFSLLECVLARSGLLATPSSPTRCGSLKVGVYFLRAFGIFMECSSSPTKAGRARLSVQRARSRSCFLVGVDVLPTTAQIYLYFVHPELTVKWQRARRANHPPPFHHLTSLSTPGTIDDVAKNRRMTDSKGHALPSYMDLPGRRVKEEAGNATVSSLAESTAYQKMGFLQSPRPLFMLLRSLVDGRDLDRYNFPRVLHRIPCSTTLLSVVHVYVYRSQKMLLSRMSA